MAQQFDNPQTETQLREIQDKLYQHSKEVHNAGGRPAFKGLLEIMSAEATITTAIHNIKSNHGSETPGVDFKNHVKRLSATFLFVGDSGYSECVSAL